MPPVPPRDLRRNTTDDGVTLKDEGRTTKSIGKFFAVKDDEVIVDVVRQCRVGVERVRRLDLGKARESLVEKAILLPDEQDACAPWGLPIK